MVTQDAKELANENPLGLSQDWHAVPIQSISDSLEASESGLTQQQAEARRNRYGPNEIPQQLPPTIWIIILRQFKSPLVYVLGFAVVLSLGVGDEKDAAFIAMVVLLNTAIGAYQEWRAEKSSRALQKLLQINAAVLRDGEIREMKAEDIVPGDIVWLESGNRVPADIRLFTAHSLEVDESLLTGESLAVHKTPAWIGPADTPVGDRLNAVFAGSTVIRGRANGMVVATGTETVIGRLARDVMTASAGKSPLIERMETFSTTIAMATVLGAAAIAVGGILVYDYLLTEMLFFAVALAVSVIPEGLPAALTVALSVATTRMAQRNAIVRRLAAVEALGSCTLIASDKTGTLTVNELTVRNLVLPDGSSYQVTGEGYIPEGAVLTANGEELGNMENAMMQLRRTALLCNEGDLHRKEQGWSWRGDPTDIALLSMAHKLGGQRERELQQYPQINQLPFEPERRYSATFHRLKNETAIFVKGAPERVLEMCTLPKDMDFLQVADHLAAKGYRVLALASGQRPTEVSSAGVPSEPSQLNFVGFVCMIDPLRPEARSAVESCHSAGIAVSMVTGDHPATALAIAQELGLAQKMDQVMTGTQLERRSPKELELLIDRIRVFARVAPHQKLQLVEAAKRAGHFVAVTGDGVNDAPALRSANIGIAMGKAGTDVAREAAELIISDDNFSTIVAGVEEGRVAYDNVRKVVFLLVSTGAAELVALGLSVFLGLPLPLLPVQLLWLNLVTNGIQGVALAFEPSEGGVLQRPPRDPGEPIFNRLMIERTLIAAAVMGGVGLGVFWWLLENGRSETEARNVLLVLLVLFENVHIGNCRSETKSAFQLSPMRSPILFAGALSALGLHIIAMYWPPAQTMLGVAPIALDTWITLFALALTVLVAIEIHKAWYRRADKG